MVRVETAEGIIVYINANQVLMIGSVLEDGVPVVGRVRIMLLGGVGLMVKGDVGTMSNDIDYDMSR